MWLRYDLGVYLSEGTPFTLVYYGKPPFCWVKRDTNREERPVSSGKGLIKAKPIFGDSPISTRAHRGAGPVLSLSVTQKTEDPLRGKKHIDRKTAFMARG